MFAMSRVKVAIVGAFAFFVTAQLLAIGANDVFVDRGSLVFSDGIGHLDISGTESFGFVAKVGLPGGVFTAYSRCQANECVPGTVVDLHAAWLGVELQGDARLRGAALKNVGHPNGDSSAEIIFSGNATMPAMSSQPVTITAPFTFNGFFTQSANRPGVQSVMLTGSGTATLRLRPNSDRTRWYFDQVVFTFEPGKPQK